ncbi:MAG: AAA family ATPase, partial [Microthrixaceae bacterium]
MTAPGQELSAAADEVPFVGRAGQLAVLREAAADVANGRARVVFVEGEAGAGKTALVRHGVASELSGFHVVWTQAEELAADEPMFVARQVTPTSASTPFAAGLELLAHLAELQVHGPAALVVEDLHWVDDVSQQTILTALRRLGDDRVLVLITSRPAGSAGSSEDPGWERVRTDARLSRRVVVGALGLDDTRALVVATGRSLRPPEVERLHRHTQGHALHTAALLGELTDEQLAAPDIGLPAPRSLASLTLGRLGTLSDDALELVSMLAVMNRATPLIELGRLAGVDDPSVALEELLGTGFVVWRPSDALSLVSFTHPLHRVAVYEDLSPVRRRRLHAAAATDVDPATAVMHRVAATDSVDEDLAVELEDLAGRELVDGDSAAAARHLRWAATVGAAGASSQNRLLRSVRAQLAGVSAGSAVRSAPEVEACADSQLRSFVLGQIARLTGDTETAERHLGLAASATGPDDDVELAAQACMKLGALHGVLGHGPDAIRWAERALQLAPHSAEVARFAPIVRTIGTGLQFGAVRGLAAAGQGTPTSRGPDDPELAATTGMLHLYASHRTAAERDLVRTIRATRSGAIPPQLPRAHIYLSQVQFGLGDWDDALINARVALSLLAQGESAWLDVQAHAAASSVLSARGDDEAAREHLEAAATST